MRFSSSLASASASEARDEDAAAEEKWALWIEDGNGVVEAGADEAGAGCSSSIVDQGD